jgi:excisionase family DNA binding protein
MIPAPTKLLTIEEKLSLKFAFRIEEAAELAGIGRTQMYEVVQSGALVARKRGCRTLILPDDLRAWLAALPTVAEAAADPTAKRRGGKAVRAFHRTRPVKRVLKPRRAVA